MARLGYLGFTINLTKRADGGRENVLIFAGAGTEAVTMERMMEDVDELLELAEEKNNFKHWSEVWVEHRGGLQ